MLQERIADILEESNVDNEENQSMTMCANAHFTFRENLKLNCYVI